MEDLRNLVPDWQLHLRAANKAPRTITSYVAVAEEFVRWLVKTEQPTGCDVSKTTVEGFLTYMQSRPSKRGGTLSAASVAVTYRSLQQFFRWLSDVEEVIPVSPFAKLSAPAVPVQPVPVISDDHLKALLESCKGKAFQQRRDEALIRLFLDTGCRCSEIANLSIEDLDFDVFVIHVVGKGRRARSVPFGAKTAEALRRYLRARNQHPKALSSKALWLGKKGTLTDFGIRQLLNRRTKAVGLPHIHPHMFRHTFAHQWLSNDGQETDLMRIAGWRSRDMVARYGASAADARARDAHRKAALGDRF
jgi:site-specific recombinase XerD